MLLYRLGSYAVNSTDNILISVNFGIIAVANFSSYTFLLNTAMGIVNSLTTSLTPSIGNQSATTSTEAVLDTFNKLLFMFFWLAAFTTAMFAALITPFINLWLGADFIISDHIVILLLFNYYISFIRRLMVSYRNALGLYLYAKLKPIAEGILNLVISIILLKYLGLFGIVLETTLSELLTSFWIEPYVLYKHYFKAKMVDYWRKYFTYAGIALLMSTSLWLLSKHLYSGTILSFIVLACLGLLITNLLLVVIYHNNKYFKSLKQSLQNILLKRGIKRNEI